MTTGLFPKTVSSGMNLDSRSLPGYGYAQIAGHTQWSLRWGVYRDTDPSPVAFGQVELSGLQNRIADLLKLERQQRERLAAVWLDQCAQNLLRALDQETSIKWEDLPDRANCDWSEASRSAALLAGANLCEVSPTRIRLNEYGDKLLAESSSAA